MLFIFDISFIKLFPLSCRSFILVSLSSFLILYSSAEEINTFNWLILGLDIFLESFGGKSNEYCFCQISLFILFSSFLSSNLTFFFSDKISNKSLLSLLSKFFNFCIFSLFIDDSLVLSFSSVIFYI